jgi:hypothetical protein
MRQPDDHERTGHGTAGLAGARHPRTEGARDAKRSFAVQTGPLPVGGQDRLSSGETVEEQGKRLFNIIFVVFSHINYRLFELGKRLPSILSRAEKGGTQRCTFTFVFRGTLVAFSKKTSLVPKIQSDESGSRSDIARTAPLYEHSRSRRPKPAHSSSPLRYTGR